MMLLGYKSRTTATRDQEQWLGGRSRIMWFLEAIVRLHVINPGFALPVSEVLPAGNKTSLIGGDA
jgi:hypothetical protein